MAESIQQRLWKTHYRDDGVYTIKIMECILKGLWNVYYRDHGKYT